MLFRSDRREVLRLAQGLDQPGRKIVIDQKRLKPGARFEETLLDEIADSDVFVLCWSRNAAKSDWVDKEARHAASCEQTAGRPDIWPKPLELPVPLPPDYLSDRHFGDLWAQMIEAEQSIARKRGGVISWIRSMIL